MARGISHQWTKEDIKKVATLWDTNTTAEIKEQLGISTNQLTYIVGEMRKNGFTLPKKHKNGYIRALIEECRKEMRR